MAALSQRHTASHTESQRATKRRKRKNVRFEHCATDIVTALFDRADFDFSQTVPSTNCRPILKYSTSMSEYFKRAGTTFARALAAFGTWASGVVSVNPNVRSDMYKQIVAQIRGTSAHLRPAGESVLHQNIAGMWLQLVEDFSMQREEYSPANIELYVFYPIADIGITMRRRLLELCCRVISVWRSLMSWIFRCWCWRF
jgi:hypothetical protein